MVLRACEAQSKATSENSRSEEADGVTELSNGQHSLPNGVIASTSKHDVQEPPQKKVGGVFSLDEDNTTPSFCNVKNVHTKAV